MKQTIYYLLFLGVITFSVGACTAVKTADGTTIRKKSTRFLTKKLESQKRTDYKWFAGKAKMKYQDMAQNQSVRTTVRVQKDSAIWASFSLLGIEGVRVLITPDSLKMLNRLNQTYFTSDFYYLERNFQVPLDFQGLQDMIVGNPLYFEENEGNWASDIVNELFMVTGKTLVESSYFMNTNSYLLEQMIFEDKSKNRKIDVRLERYKKEEDKSRFSYFRDIYISSPTTGNAQLQIDYSRIEFDVQKSMPFKIPTKYKRME